MSLAVALLLLAPTRQAETYDLLWRPAAGQHLVYEVKMQGDLVEEPFVYTSQVHLRVKKVEPNGDYTLGTQFTGGKFKYGDQDQTLGDDPEEVQRYDKMGDLLDDPQYSTDEESDVVSELIGQATDFSPPPKPVKLHESWSKEVPENKNLHLPAATRTYRLAALSQADGTQTAVVTYTYNQKKGLDPIKAQGVIVLETKDGSLVSVTTNVENLPLAEGAPPTKAKLTMKRGRTGTSLR